MTPQFLATVGEALFGPLWQTQLAGALKISDRTIRRWASGESDIPEGVTGDLIVLCNHRAAALLNITAKLAESMRKGRSVTDR